MSEATKKELQRVKDEQAYWKRLELIVPWKLYGWTGRHIASFFTEKDSQGRWTAHMEVSGKMLDDIVKAIQDAEMNTERG